MGSENPNLKGSENVDLRKDLLEDQVQDPVQILELVSEV